MSVLTISARKQFDHWSHLYDWDPLQFFFFRPSHRMLLNALSDADERVLDIGCGTCQFAVQVLNQFPRAHVWGLDLSPGMLRQGQKQCEQAEGRLNLVQGDSSSLPFADDSFDAITCSHSFHHYPRQERVVAQMHRVLRPGGRLLIIDGDRDRLWGRMLFQGLVVMMEGPVHHLTSGAFRELFRAAGFQNVTQRRRKGPLPFLMTVGEAVKPLQNTPI